MTCIVFYMHHSRSIFKILRKTTRFWTSTVPFKKDYQLHGWQSNLVTLIGESLTSHVITLTPILAKILTSDPYSYWPLLLRMRY